MKKILWNQALNLNPGLNPKPATLNSKPQTPNLVKKILWNRAHIEILKALSSAITGPIIAKHPGGGRGGGVGGGGGEGGGESLINNLKRQA